MYLQAQFEPQKATESTAGTHHTCPANFPHTAPRRLLPQGQRSTGDVSRTTNVATGVKRRAMTAHQAHAKPIAAVATTASTVTAAPAAAAVAALLVEMAQTTCARRGTTCGRHRLAL